MATRPKRAYFEEVTFPCLCHYSQRVFSFAKTSWWSTWSFKWHTQSTVLHCKNEMLLHSTELNRSVAMVGGVTFRTVGACRRNSHLASVGIMSLYCCGLNSLIAATFEINKKIIGVYRWFHQCCSWHSNIYHTLYYLTENRSNINDTG